MFVFYNKQNFTFYCVFQGNDLINDYMFQCNYYCLLNILQSSAMTVVRGQEEMCISASPLERSNLHAFLMRCRSRTISSTSAISEHSDQLDDDDDSHGSNSHLSVSNRYRTISGHHDNTGSDDDDIPESPASSSLMSPTNSELLSPPIRIARRTRFISESDDTTSADVSNLNYLNKILVIY